MADLDALDWRLIAEETHSGARNMALEEVAAETAAAGGPATIRLFRWQPSTLSLGYNQDPSTIDWDACREAGVGVTRRPTGGGAIYHDHEGDVSYSIAIPGEAAPGDLNETYERLCVPIVDACERLGVPVAFAAQERPAIHEPACFLRALDPAHDLVGPDGRKVAGNAQFRRRDAVVQHGSLRLSLASERHAECFTAALDPDRYERRVGSLEDHASLDRAAAVEALREALVAWSGARVGSWSDDERDRASALEATKYDTAAWTRHGETEA